MKKSKRTWLLLAGTVALSATLLVPTVLSACSTTPNTENPGDDTNKPGGDTNNPGDGGNTPGDTTNKLDAQIKKLNESNNVSIRRNIYEQYIGSLNLSGNNSDIVKNATFFDQLEQMLKSGLNSEATSTLNTLFSSENKGVMINQGMMPASSGSGTNNGTSGSFWSFDSFKFKDNTDATWTFLDTKKETIYELYLTENVEFTYESTAQTISVKVKNKATGSKVKSRLVVTNMKSTTEGGGESGGSQTKQSAGTTPSAPTVKEYNFKDDVEFKLPENLFTKFNSFLNKYDEQTNTSKNELKNGYKTYQDKLTTLSSAATIWNQYVKTNQDELLKNLASDLNVNRASSNVAKWISNNIADNNELVKEFEKDLQSAKNVYLELDDLLITGSQTDNNGLNNATGEEPDYTLIITFEADEQVVPDGESSGSQYRNKTSGTEGSPAQPDSLDEKWYILNLKATNFKFTTSINEQFFGYESSSFTTKPSLQLDGKSSFASYQLISTGNTVQGYEEGDVKELKKANLKTSTGSMTDVSMLYDANNNGFSKFLSTLILDKSNSNKQLTDQLIDVNAKGAKNTISKLNDYLKANKTEIEKQLLGEQDVLADLILENIDLSNLAMKSEKFGHVDSTDTFPSSVDTTNDNIIGWRKIINNWIRTGYSDTNSKLEVVINGQSQNVKSFDSTISSAADIVVQSKLNDDGKTPQHPLRLGTLSGENSWNNKDLQFRSIYIFLGDDSKVDSLVNGTTGTNKSASLNVDLKSDLNPTDSNSNQTYNVIKEKVKGNFCILFEKAKFDSTQESPTPPVYGFYMGQQKVQSSSGRTGDVSTQSKFSISLDGLLGDGSKFLKTLLGKIE